MPAWYDRLVLPRLLDCACGLPMVTRQRRLVVPQASGRVLEVGIGTGLNLPHYDRGRITSLTGIDPGVAMHPLAARRAREHGLDVRLVPLSAERLPLADASFDTVVVTYTLCTIPDPLAALREMRRVLAPGGRLLFCEHGRAPEPSVQRWQARLQPLWGRLAGGCHLGRDVPALLAQAGFALPELHTGYIPGPRPLAFHYCGRALGQSADAHAPH
jgi:ubiquinone/menaquinone biosynthesis C-methylase UbiE